MPFDFKKMKPYEIDYGALFREVSKKHILYDKQIQENYLRNWLLELQKCDRILTTQLGNPDGFQICLKHMCEEPETFQFPIHFDHVTLFLHFRISYINKICNSQYTQGELVSLSEFQGPDKSICWTPVNNPVEQYATITKVGINRYCNRRRFNLS